VKSDPFAPATSPSHAKNLLDVDPVRNALAELIELHATDHEQRFLQYPDADELRRRQTLVDEYREQLATEGPDAEPPTLLDLLNEAYQWREGDRTEDDPDEPSGQPDGENSSGWVYLGDAGEADPERLPVPPRNGPGSDTETWRAFAIQEIGPNASWVTMNRGEIIAALEAADKIPSGDA
jgi:hypothetical protein